MSLTLRFVLFTISAATCIWILLCIRKSRAKIEDSVFWILFSFFLVFISVFPQVVEWGTQITGVQTPVNFLFLSIIFVLIVKLFRISIKVSHIENKLQAFAQTYALHRLSDAEEERNNDPSK